MQSQYGTKLRADKLIKWGHWRDFCQSRILKHGGGEEHQTGCNRRVPELSLGISPIWYVRFPVSSFGKRTAQFSEGFRHFSCWRYFQRIDNKDLSRGKCWILWNHLIAQAFWIGLLAEFRWQEWNVQAHQWLSSQPVSPCPDPSYKQIFLSLEKENSNILQKHIYSHLRFIFWGPLFAF